MRDKGCRIPQTQLLLFDVAVWKYRYLNCEFQIITSSHILLTAAFL